MRKLLLIALFFLPQFAHADITSNLTVWWKLNDGSGTSAVDSSGNGYTTTLYNSPTWISGTIGTGALDFDSTDYTEAASTASVVNNPTAITVAFWMKSSTNAGNFVDIVSKFDDYFSGAGWAAETFTGHAAFIIQGPGGSDWLQKTADNTTPYDGTWHHYVMTCDRNTATIHIYFDSVDQTLTDHNGGSTTFDSSSSANIMLARNATGNQFTGALDDVRIYERILSQGDVDELYAYTESAPSSSFVQRISDWFFFFDIF